MKRIFASSLVFGSLLLLLSLHLAGSTQAQPILQATITPEAPIIDFPALPAFIETNLSTFVVAGSTSPSNTVQLNGTPLPPEARDQVGNFVLAVPLLTGDNVLELTIKSGDEVVVSATKTVRLNANLSTNEKRLLYVDSVPLPEDVPAVTGTIVIDLDNDALLGLIVDKHVVGISPDGTEIYASDRTVINTSTHRETRTLSFTLDIRGHGFLVSPDGDRLYSRNERLDVPSNTLLENLPLNIVTGNSWAGAPVPGGPAISADSRYIYCNKALKIIDTQANTFITTTIRGGDLLSDIALTPDGNKILISEYDYGNGRLDVYISSTFEPSGTVSGLEDFAGEIVFSQDGHRAIVGCAGNPRRRGRVTVVDLDTLEKLSMISLHLADNLATSGNDEFFISTGENGLIPRLGIDVYILEPSGKLVRTKTFFLGINGFVSSTGRPRHDQIRRIIFKPSISYQRYLPIVMHH